MYKRQTQILTRDRHATGVRTARSEYESKAVAAAFPLSHLFEIIDENLFTPSFVRYAKEMRSSNGVSIDFVFDQPITDRQGSILGVDVPLWVKFQTNVDPTLAPPGKQVMTWAMLNEPGMPLTDEAAARIESHIKTIMEELFPGALAKVVRERKLILPKVNGVLLTPEQSFPHRPPVISKDIEGIYFIGDTVQGEGCSGDIAFSSAIKAAEAIL